MDNPLQDQDCPSLIFAPGGACLPRVSTGLDIYRVLFTSSDSAATAVLLTGLAGVGEHPRTALTSSGSGRVLLLYVSVTETLAE